MPDMLLDLAIPSRLDALDAAGTRLGAALRRLGLDGEARHRVGLAVHEALANAIIHGHRQDSGRTVAIQLERDGEGIVIRVADQGPGFDPTGVADPLRPENRLLPGGRGLLLMKALTDAVSHESGATGGSIATLRWRMGGDQSARIVHS